MIFVIIVALLILINVKTFFKCLAYKLQYKEKVIFLFFPFFGIVAFNFFGYIIKRDYFYVQKYLAKKYPNAKFIVANFLLNCSIQLLDPQLIKEFTQRHNEIHKIVFFPDAALLNQGLLMTKGSTWKTQRQILSQSFSFDELKKRVPKIKEIAIQRLEEMNLEKENVNLTSLFSEITGEVVIQTFFGNEISMKRLENGKKTSVEITELMGELFTLVRNIYYHYKMVIFKNNSFNVFPTKREKQMKARFDQLSNIIKKIVLRKVQEHTQNKGNNIQYVYFVDIYIDYFVKNNITINEDVIQEICSQFMTIFFAGTDTTSHLLAFMAYQLAIHPNIQNIVRQETSIVNQQDIDMKSLSNIQKTQAFINEVLRIYPPTPFLMSRKCPEEIKMLEFTFPKGQMINISIIFNTNNPKYFEDPSEIKLERWDKELKEPFSFTPFSAGPRHCIGQHLAILEAKIIIGIVLKNYRLEKIAGKEQRLVAQVLYELEDDNLVKFIKLN